MIARPHALLCVCFVLIAACGAEPAVPTLPISANEDTTLGEGDIFEVRVFGEEAFSGTFRVGGDGSIDFPYVGRTQVAGSEPRQVADVIRAGLIEHQILVNPQVTVTVTEYNSKHVTVTGAVAAEGRFPMTSGMTVVQAISLAGGFTPLANRNATVLTRVIDGRQQDFVVPVETIQRGRGRDIPLRAGDVLFVPERVF